MHQVRVPICPCRTRVIPAVTVTSSIFYPSSYLVNFMLDSTVGLLLIYALLKAVACLVNRCNITPLRSGEYGACDNVCVACLVCDGAYFVLMQGSRFDCTTGWPSC